MMIKRIRKYIPYVVAAVMAANGFLNLAAGLSSIFGFAEYLRVDMGDVPEFLHVTPQLELSGLVWVILGTMLIALGKGLAERRLRAWWWALGVLALLLANSLYQGVTLRTSGLSLSLIVLLVSVRAEFALHPERRRWSYTELVAAVSVVFALAFGIVGSYLLRREFDTIETWTDAVYFSVVTFSTMGYGDILPVTQNARIFTVLMVAIGLSAFATALTVLVGPLLEERMKGVFTVMSRLQKTIDHVVVCGFTKVTESIVDELRERGVPFILIEDSESIHLLLAERGLDVVHGDPTERATLMKANLTNAEAVIAATDSDATNTLIALTAKELRDTDDSIDFRIIVRVEDEENIRKVRQIGADEVISPSTLGGRAMAVGATGQVRSSAPDITP